MRFQKGHKPWNTGTKGVVKANSGSFKVGQNSNENHPMWKGDNAGYLAKHKWIQRHFGTPSKCEGCGTNGAKKFEWANLSGLYKRIRADWLRLCSSCHQAMDGHRIKQWQTRRAT